MDDRRFKVCSFSTFQKMATAIHLVSYALVEAPPSPVKRKVYFMFT